MATLRNADPKTVATLRERGATALDISHHLKDVINTLDGMTVLDVRSPQSPMSPARPRSPPNGVSASRTRLPSKSTGGADDVRVADGPALDDEGANELALENPSALPAFLVQAHGELSRDVLQLHTCAMPPPRVGGGYDWPPRCSGVTLWKWWRKLLSAWADEEAARLVHMRSELERANELEVALCSAEGREERLLAAQAEAEARRAHTSILAVEVRAMEAEVDAARSVAEDVARRSSGEAHAGQSIAIEALRAEVYSMEASLKRAAASAAASSDARASESRRCEQAQAHASELEREGAELRANGLRMEEELRRLRATLASAQPQAEALHSQLHEASVACAEARLRADALESENGALQRQISSLEALVPRNHELGRQVEATTTMLEEARGHGARLREEVAALRGELQAAKAHKARADRVSLTLEENTKAHAQLRQQMLECQGDNAALLRVRRAPSPALARPRPPSPALARPRPPSPMVLRRPRHHHTPPACATPPYLPAPTPLLAAADAMAGPFLGPRCPPSPSRVRAPAVARAQEVHARNAVRDDNERLHGQLAAATAQLDDARLEGLMLQKSLSASRAEVAALQAECETRREGDHDRAAHEERCHTLYDNARRLHLQLQDSGSPGNASASPPMPRPPPVVTTPTSASPSPNRTPTRKLMWGPRASPDGQVYD